jgi:recombination protein U
VNIRLKNFSYANRGMILEDDINKTNIFYKEHNIALIYKKPTPIKVVKVTYPQNRINEAYFGEPSTLDYNGIYKGKYIEFDAKETQSKTSFPLSNIHKHQLEHIKGVIFHGGITFLVVRFVTLNKTFILMGSDLISFINNSDRKSIPYDYFEEYGYVLELKYNPRLDYISIIDKIIKDKDVGDNEN